MPEPRLPPISGLTNVIGKPSQYEKIWFVPVLGDFSFTSQQHFLSKYADLDWLNEIQDEELYCNDALWVRARLIKLFGIHHPSGHALSTLLNFQAIAIEIIPGRKQPESITPLIVSDTLDGCIDDYGYTPLAAMAFESGVDSQLQLRIAGSFWSLLLSQPYELGIFVDYWYSDYDESMFRVECDGQRIYYDLLGACIQKSAKNLKMQAVNSGGRLSYLDEKRTCDSNLGRSDACESYRAPLKSTWRLTENICTQPG